jgi:hypothetical protein
VLPPGLYEATFEARGNETLNADRAAGQWVMRCEARALNDIRAMGGNSPEDAAVRGGQALSELNLAAHQKFLQPWVKKMVTPQMADWARNMHPLRMQYEAFSSKNSWMSTIESAADRVEDNRRPVSKDNPFMAFQEQMSKQIVHALDSWRDAQEALSETVFLNVYGSPALQAAVGIDPNSAPSRRREMSAEHRAMLDKRVAELNSRMGVGGLREAAIRALLYVGSARGMVDERSIEALRRIRRDHHGERLTPHAFKTLVREQFFMLLLDRDAALGAIPNMLPNDLNPKRAAFAAMREVLSASEDISGERANRLTRVCGLFGLDGEESGRRMSPLSPPKRGPRNTHGRKRE